MTSTIDICNIALGYVKGSRITALDGSSEEARLCEALYPHARRCVFEEHNWNTLLTRTQLAPSSTVPAFQYTNQFQLPEDPKCIRVVSVMDQANNPINDYTIEGNKILANANIINIIYVGEVVDTNSYNGMLVECIARKMACFLAFNMSGIASYVSMMEDIYRKTIDEARSLDSSQGQQGATYIDHSYLFSFV